MRRFVSLILFTAFIASTVLAEIEPSASDEWTPRDLSVEDRVAAQTAIERVYWAHRSWPDQNPAPKPDLNSVFPEDAIRAKVDDYLKKNEALEKYWNHSITTADLGAEFKRILRQTRNPAMLKELIGALDGDRLLILECLVRPVLVNRLVRNWYASDSRFHGQVESSALAELGTNPSLDQLKTTSGQYNEVVWRREVGPTSDDREVSQNEIALPSVDFDRWAEMIQVAALVDPDAEQEASVTSLRESPQSFYIMAVLDWQQDRVVLGVTSWAKRSFSEWWEEVSGQVNAELPVGTLGESGGVSVEGAVANLDDVTCRIDDTWKSIWEVPSHRSSHTAVWTGAEMIVWGGRYSSTGSTNVNTGGRYDPALDVWTRTSTGPNVPSVRMEHTAVWTGTQMIVWGGRDDQIYLNTGAVYDPTNDTWMTVSSGPDVPTPRSSHTAIWADGEMIIWGGWNGVQHSNSGSRYDPSTNTWSVTSVTGDVPTPRREHSAIWTDTEMIVWGGYGGAYVNSGGRYDPSTDTWTSTSIGTSVPAIRSGHSAVWTGTEMIVWGGGPSGVYLSTGGRYRPGTDSWMPTSTEAESPVSRKGHTAIWTGDEMIIWGGNSAVYLNNGGRYTPDSDSWTATSIGANVLSPRTRHTAVWTDTEMIVWGGFYYDGFYSHYYNTGARYTPATDSWLPTAADAGVPLARRYHSAISTESEMIVWGGLYDESPEHTNTGARYDPVLDSWTPTSTGANVPASRYEHTAVWTGTEMIIWSGKDNYPIRTGARYNPMTDSWLPTSTGTNTPAGRQHHTAVWSGTEMIVWGGRDLSRFFTGGRYNPVSDTWLPTSTGVGVPSGRYDHSAVWSGSEMIVWGGSTSTPTNTGSRYDPSVDSWTSIPVSATTPAARARHTAVWNGTEMIVWSGAGSNVGNTGGRYDPVTHVWNSTSTGSGTPTGRTFHSAIWAPSVGEMLVWGGSGVTLLNSGGRYNPAANSWTATSTGNHCPSRRWHQTAVWIGSEMLVWGGRDVDLLNTGGLYCACVMLDWYADVDGDGFGDLGDHKSECLQPAGYVDNALDCDDTNGAINPGATEFVADGVDQNCDTLELCYQDLDGDNYGTSATVTSTDLLCTDAGESTVSLDCDDTNGAINPAADEVCDAVDNDCDTLIDDADPGVTDASDWYADTDSDTYGDPGVSQAACTQPDEYVTDDTDCNDANGAINPGAMEFVADGVDQNCDTLELCYQDLDGDNYGTSATVTSTDLLCTDAGESTVSLDCDDTNGAINPAADEVCDAVDNDCDTLIDDADPGVTGTSTWYADADSDSYGDTGVLQAACSQPGGYVADNTDCNDANGAINPGAMEFVADGVDQNCDTLELCYQDLDDDNYGTSATVTSTDLLCTDAGESTVSLDCDDTNGAINPAADEVCDAVDNDCDTLIDDADPDVTGTSTWYADTDSDSYGDPGVLQAACSQPGGYVADNTDCNDANGAINPGATEFVADGVDQNCDTLELCYQDLDGDNYGTSATVTSTDLLCTDAGESTVSLDCDDTNGAINPAADEVCDAVDNDCDTLIDDADPDVIGASTWYADTDSDSYGDPGVLQAACSQPGGYVADNTDCNDSDGTAWSPPSEILDLLLSKSSSSDSELTWSSQSASAGDGIEYGIVTATLDSLRTSEPFALALCLSDGLSANTYLDQRNGPDSGQGWYYLARPRNSCGVATYGDASVTPDPRDDLDASSPCP